jgi:hypothetical protein
MIPDMQSDATRAADARKPVTESRETETAADRRSVAGDFQADHEKRWTTLPHYLGGELSPLYNGLTRAEWRARHVENNPPVRGRCLQPAEQFCDPEAPCDGCAAWACAETARITKHDRAVKLVFPPGDDR